MYLLVVEKSLSFLIYAKYLYMLDSQMLDRVLARLLEENKIDVKSLNTINFRLGNLIATLFFK